MTHAVINAILVLLQVMNANIGDIDVYSESTFILSTRIQGDVHSGFIISDDTVLAEYESSNRYGQVYIVFPLEEISPNGIVSNLESENVILAETDGEQTISQERENEILENIDNEIPQYATGKFPAYILDFTPILYRLSISEGAELTLPNIVSSDLQELQSNSIAKDQGLSEEWIVTRMRDRVSLANPNLSLIIIGHF